ncbi:acetyl/propionyl/methylcrotonyl-CoA carboxylase subunit alpha [Streptomyces sp. NPDC058373]|uniref:acetyl/propionyl/methylcrotonyl-CoA carboxylase subunit alpha n=1 Tax=unclassified Streptomyces TaxID=2593676 RepID=UPI00365F5698
MTTTPPITDEPQGTPLTSVLVANRGEIARRVIRTCRHLGLATTAVYADPDASAAHVRDADAAVRLPGDAPAGTYLRGDLVIAAARAAGADAIHPGYGFLSENAAFARAVQDAQLTWIGPDPEAIEAMASKTRAKKLMAAAGVPLLGPLDPDTLTDNDLPVLVKAASGGGGRGMRVVTRRDDLPAALEAAAAEALSAFGDGEVFVEPYLPSGRHVEVQILGDRHGTVWTLGTRDCSLQRRHQKVVEEAPAPGLPDALRERLHEAAAAAARAIGYTGAGTVEFLVADGQAYFLEMNTRLQVEHPVTEAVHGVDLVALQLAVAEGQALPAAPPPARGHAVEARLYAEDPAADWAPQTGTVHRLDLPGADRDHLPGREPAPLRLDTGYEAGDTVGVHYDAMLAKVIAWGPTRAAAIRRLAAALTRARLHGPATNRDLLVRSLAHPDFTTLAGLDTAFYTRHLDTLTRPADDARPAAVAAALADAAHAAARSRLGAGGWRNLRSEDPVRRYRADDGTAYEIRYRPGRHGWVLPGEGDPRPVSVTPDAVVLADGSAAGAVERQYEVTRSGGRVHVDGPHGTRSLTPVSRHPDTAARQAPGSLLAPMPGTVVRVADGLAEGSAVTAGQPLVWLEAMKMEHRVLAPASGTLTALHARPGHQVEVGALLAVVQEEPA